MTFIIKTDFTHNFAWFKPKEKNIKASESHPKFLNETLTLLFDKFYRYILKWSDSII